jgi:hypothetical protein
VGDFKALYEAKDLFDYTLAVVGALGPLGDGAAAAIRAAKAAHQAGNAAEVANQLQKVDYFAKSVQQVNGRLPINSAYAGKIYPASMLPVEIRGKYPHGIPFTAQGFPDFSRYSIRNVNIEMGATRTQDFLRADSAAGYTKSNPRPAGYTWHHHQENGYMQLIPTDLHFHVKHTGGIATAK